MDFSNPDSPNVGAVIPCRNAVTSIAYHEAGKRLFVASSADARLQIIDCLNGKAEQPALRCEREQIHLVVATHHENNVLFAGKGSPTQQVGQRNAVNYWSLYDNKILRKFRGHSDKITNISMCPADDTFLTSSLDRTVRLWNASQAGCLAEMKLPDETYRSPLAAFDSTGLVFAVTAAMKGEVGHYVHLYDARNYNAGAFAELKVNREDLEKAIRNQPNVPSDQAILLSKVDWTSLHFNLSGNQILVGADKGMSVIIDGFEGTVQRVLVGTSERPAVSCITPDDKTLLQGNDDGTISCWNIETGRVVKTLQGHPGPVGCIAANPKYAQIASSCMQTALWIW